jgi:hypothetical protein
MCTISILGALSIISLILTNKHFITMHFTDGETKTQRGKVICPSLHRAKVAERNFNPSSPKS